MAAETKTRPTLIASELGPYRTVGMTLIPLHRWDYVDGKGRERGKSPRDREWQSRPYDRDEVAEEAARDGTNVGVRLTRDWVVLDVDPRNFGEDEAGRPRDVLFELDLEIGLELATAPHTVTGSGGHHYWYRKPPDVDLIDSLKDFPGIEFKSRGRQVVSAGSVHPRGRNYAWDPAAPPLAEAREMPSLLLLLARRQRATTAGARGSGELSADRLAEALDQLPVEEFREHDRWRDLMMACHHATAGEGRQEFIDWSTGDPSYADQAWMVGRRWDSLHHEGAVGAAGSRPITARFLYQQVLVRGGTVPVDGPEVDFEPIDAGAEDGAGDASEPTREAERRSTLDEMNERHCIVDDGGKFRVYSDRFDPVLGRKFYVRHAKTDFLDLNARRRIEVPAGDGETKTVSVGAWWLGQGGARQYDGVLFDPEHNYDGWLNLWTGWSVEPERGDWSLLRQLIRENLCDGDEELDAYVMRWMSYMVGHPATPAGVALVLRGAKGTGKGTLGRVLARLAGRHGMHISSPEHLVGRFNCVDHSTEILTRDRGVVRIGDVAGQLVTLLDGNREWVRCQILDLGERETWETSMGAGSGAGTIGVRATADHRWITPEGGEVATSKLCQRTRVADLRPSKAVVDGDEYRRGVVHGLVYGDGSRHSTNGYSLSAFTGPKREAFAPWMAGFSRHDAHYENRSGSGTGDRWLLPRAYTATDLKALPDAAASGDDYLLGFLRGWLAADGCVSEKPGSQSASIHCDLAGWKWLERWAPVRGWLVTGATPRNNEGEMRPGWKPTHTGYDVNLARRSIDREDLLLRHHRERWSPTESRGWRGSWAGPRRAPHSPRTERVYCAHVPTTGSFALASGVHSGNSHLRDCICLFADEAFWAGDKRGESVLKALVTEPTLFFEAKGKDGEQGKNLIHVVIASNSDWVVPAGMDRERRFCVAEVNEARVGDHAFFGALNAQMEDGGGTAAMLYDLMALSERMGDWAPRDGVPQTRGLVDQKLRSMDLQTSWWHARLTDGFLPNQRGEWRDGQTTVLKEFLRRDFQTAAKDAGWGRAGNETEFGLKMSKLCPGVQAKQVTAAENEYGVKTDVKGRAMAYVLPDLATCRGRFEDQLGGKVRWPAVEGE